MLKTPILTPTTYSNIGFCSRKSPPCQQPTYQATCGKSPQTVVQKLDRTSDACKFFGVDSRENIMTSIRNHEKLNRVNEYWRTNNSSGSIVNIGVMSTLNTKTEKEYLHKPLGKGVYGRPWTLIDEIKSQGAAKITFTDKLFGNNTYGMHTIGLVTKDNYLYVLDSLGEQTKDMKEFHSKIAEIFSDAGFKKIIFSSKPQQSFDEYTCNNWTFANIKTVTSEVFGKNKEIKTTEELDKILREDINNILVEQQEQVLWY